MSRLPLSPQPASARKLDGAALRAGRGAAFAGERGAVAKGRVFVCVQRWRFLGGNDEWGQWKDLGVAAGAQSARFSRECFLPLLYLVSCLREECHPPVDLGAGSASEVVNAVKGNPHRAGLVLPGVSMCAGSSWLCNRPAGFDRR